MNVEVLDEARLDIADGVAFYDRQSDGAGDYFIERIFDDIEALVLLALDELSLLAAGIIPLVFIWFVLGLRLGKEYDLRVDGAQLAPH